MAETKKTFAEHFTPEEAATYKRDSIAELTKDALSNLTRAAYLLHAREDIIATHLETLKLGEPLEAELKEINDTKTPSKPQRERRKELERALAPIRMKLRRLQGDTDNFAQQAEQLYLQSVERIYRRDYIAKHFPEAVLSVEAPDPRMKADQVA